MQPVGPEFHFPWATSLSMKPIYRARYDRLMLRIAFIGFLVLILLGGKLFGNVPVITPRPAGNNRPIQRVPIPPANLTFYVSNGVVWFPVEMPLCQS